MPENEQETLFEHPATKEEKYDTIEQEVVATTVMARCTITTVDGFVFQGVGLTADKAKQAALAKLDYCEKYALTVKGNTIL